MAKVEGGPLLVQFNRTQLHIIANRGFGFINDESLEKHLADAGLVSSKTTVTTADGLRTKLYQPANLEAAQALAAA